MKLVITLLIIILFILAFVVWVVDDISKDLNEISGILLFQIKDEQSNAKHAYDKGYKDGMFAKECDRDGDCYGCKFDQPPKDSKRCEGCCRNYADGYVKGDK